MVLFLSLFFFFILLHDSAPLLKVVISESE
jgi:hypothetical protein